MSKNDKTTEQTTALAVVNLENYAVAELGADGFLEVIGDNLGGGTLNWTDLERIKVPSAGSVYWTLPDSEQPVKEFEGVIVLSQFMRGYWQSDDAASGSPPDCSSRDNTIGVGLFGKGSAQNPDGFCMACPMAQFGTGKGGNGQACKLKQMLFVMRPDSYLPTVVAVPAGSLQNAKRYFLELTGKRPRAPHYGVVTKFGLAKAQSATKIDYSQITFTRGATLSPEMAGAMKSIRDRLRPAISGVAYDVFEDAA